MNFVTELETLLSHHKLMVQILANPRLVTLIEKELKIQLVPTSVPEEEDTEEETTDVGKWKVFADADAFISSMLKLDDQFDIDEEASL